MKHICILTIIAMALPFNLLFAQMETREDTLTKVSYTFFALYKKGQTGNIPELFHFPPSDSQSQVDKDTKYIAASIKAFREEFGEIKNKKLVSYQKPSQDFRIGVGGVDYWQNHLDFERLTYSVNFSKAGEGYLLFDFCNISSKWQIGFLRFALTLSNPKSEQIFSEIGKIMWELKQE
jgi:hypothetical protein